MTNLDERIHDLPPEGFARSAHAAADLAIRAAKLAGKEPPASALWIKKQSKEELSAQQQQRLDNESEAEDRAQAVRHTDVSPSNVIGVLDGALAMSPGTAISVVDFSAAAAAHTEPGEGLLVGVPGDLLYGYVKRWEQHSDGSYRVVPTEAETDSGAGAEGAVRRRPTSGGRRR